MPVFGLIEATVGTGLSMVKLTELDAPPPGKGLVTFTGTVPPVASWLARILTVIVVPPLETVPVLLVPLKFTFAPVTKFVPVTVSVAIAWPTRPLDGLTEVTVGTGLLIVKLAEFDAPPPGAGFVTTTETVPPICSSLAVMLAVIVVPPLETVPALEIPLKSTVAPGTKLVPVTVRVEIGWPTSAVEGLVEVTTGTGFVVTASSTDRKRVESLLRGAPTCGELKLGHVGSAFPVAPFRHPIGGGASPTMMKY